MHQWHQPTLMHTGPWLSLPLLLGPPPLLHPPPCHLARPTGHFPFAFVSLPFAFCQGIPIFSLDALLSFAFCQGTFAPDLSPLQLGGTIHSSASFLSMRPFRGFGNLCGLHYVSFIPVVAEPWGPGIISPFDSSTLEVCVEFTLQIPPSSWVHFSTFPPLSMDWLWDTLSLILQNWGKFCFTMNIATCRPFFSFAFPFKLFPFLGCFALRGDVVFAPCFAAITLVHHSPEVLGCFLGCFCTLSCFLHFFSHCHFSQLSQGLFFQGSFFHSLSFFQGIPSRWICWSLPFWQGFFATFPCWQGMGFHGPCGPHWNQKGWSLTQKLPIRNWTPWQKGNKNDMTWWRIGWTLWNWNGINQGRFLFEIVLK